MLEIEKKGEHDRQRSYLKLDIMFEIKKIDEHGWKVGFQIRVFFFHGLFEEEEENFCTFVEVAFILLASLHVSSTYSLSKYAIVET